MVKVVRALLFCGLLAGCAGYQKKADESRSLLRSGQFQTAVESLKPLAQKQNDDQLVYLLDYGTVQQSAGNYKESNDALLKADKISDIVDYHSLSRNVGSLVLNEGMIQYKGDDYEKVMINALIAINFLMLNDHENALVEARRLNEKLYKYKFEAKRDYEQNPFAFYLSGLLWEADGNFDNAYIQYTKAHGTQPGLSYLKEDLIRGAIAAQRPEEAEKWQKAFPGVSPRPNWKSKGYGEIVLIYAQGWGPRKFPHPSFPRIPKLYPTPSSTQFAKLDVEGVGSENSQVVLSVQDVAIRTLDDQYAGLIAKRVAGLAAKAVVADQIRQKNQLLGDLTWIGLNLADQADLRQWSTLPETFQVAKMLVPIGKYKVSVVGLNSAGSSSGETMPFQEVTVRPRKKTFIFWRSYR